MPACRAKHPCTTCGGQPALARRDEALRLVLSLWYPRQVVQSMPVRIPAFPCRLQGWSLAWWRAWTGSVGVSERGSSVWWWWWWHWLGGCDNPRTASATLKVSTGACQPTSDASMPAGGQRCRPCSLARQAETLVGVMSKRAFGELLRDGAKFNVSSNW